jgi:two-component system response regulator YesN
VYKVFLVDDEIVVREGIRNSIQWDQTPYRLVGEAADGEMALSIMKDLKPDILVTDIKMAFLDGLKLSRIMKKIQPWLKIIIISGHDEFQFARDAISIGVEEYLLKPVTAADMLASLDKVALLIEEEKKKSSSLENLQKLVQSSADLMRDRWLHDLVIGVQKPEEAIEKGRALGVDLIAHGYLAAVIEVSCPAGDSDGLSAVRAKLQSFAARQDDVIIFPQSSCSHVLILKDTGREALYETAYTLGQALKYEIERDTDCQVAIGIGTPAERIGQLPGSYAHAETVRNHMAQTGQRLIIGYNDLESLSDIDFALFDGDPIAERLKYARSSDIDDIITRYIDVYDTSQTRGSMIRYYLIGDLMMSASKIIEELGGEMKTVIPSALKGKKILDIIGTPGKFRDEVRSILEAVINFRESRVKGKHHTVIEKARQYIATHFADPDISLHSVAAEVNFSPNHFSTVFSQEKGETFIEYLTAVRIEKSKELLMSTQMRSADIAYEVGFGDPHYFSFIFKKTTGMSPREFRSGIQNKT